MKFKEEIKIKKGLFLYVFLIGACECSWLDSRGTREHKLLIELQKHQPLLIKRLKDFNHDSDGKIQVETPEEEPEELSYINDAYDRNDSEIPEKVNIKKMSPMNKKKFFLCFFLFRSLSTCFFYYYLFI